MGVGAPHWGKSWIRHCFCIFPILYWIRAHWPWTRCPLLVQFLFNVGQGNVFTPVCHSVIVGGCSPQCMLGYTPPGQTPPWADTPLSSACWDTPPAQCILGYTPPSPTQCMLGYTWLLLRTVRILLECILVIFMQFWGKMT